jgi:hypothetical protein
MSPGSAIAPPAITEGVGLPRNGRSWSKSSAFERRTRRTNPPTRSAFASLVDETTSCATRGGAGDDLEAQNPWLEGQGTSKSVLPPLCHPKDETPGAYRFCARGRLWLPRRATCQPERRLRAVLRFSRSASLSDRFTTIPIQEIGKGIERRATGRSPTPRRRKVSIASRARIDAAIREARTGRVAPRLSGKSAPTPSSRNIEAVFGSLEGRRTRGKDPQETA